ncbi:MAG: murein L,D-transpeptidase catalytic domain family protein [Muribaculaceae bacterium]|nr:murein L,D-transpeptidase catalytic domain family protein [Muribaculaceae bacterium]
MKAKVKYVVYVIAIIAVSLLGLNYFRSTLNKDITDNAKVISKFHNKAKHGEDISVFVDFSISNAYPRFFVYDNRNDSLLSLSKCAHGCGGGSTADKPVFSNTPGSMCSSLGTYRLRCVDKLHTIPFPCIRIDGLSTTNSNAAARGIVIHEAPFAADPVSIGVPMPITKYISEGCFAISHETFTLLCDLVKENKSIYLYATDNPIKPL